MSFLSKYLGKIEGGSGPALKTENRQPKSFGSMPTPEEREGEKTLLPHKRIEKIEQQVEIKGEKFKKAFYKNLEKEEPAYPEVFYEDKVSETGYAPEQYEKAFELTENELSEKQSEKMDKAA